MGSYANAKAGQPTRPRIVPLPRHERPRVGLNARLAVGGAASSRPRASPKRRVTGQIAERSGVLGGGIERAGVGSAVEHEHFHLEIGALVDRAQKRGHLAAVKRSITSVKRPCMVSWKACRVLRTSENLASSNKVFSSRLKPPRIMR